MSATSTNTSVRPESTEQRTKVRRPPEPGHPAIADDQRRQRLGSVLTTVGLAVLMGLTSWFVASISIWLVPFYVTAMVFIFVTPKAPNLGISRPDVSTDESGVEPGRGRASGSSAARKRAKPGVTNESSSASVSSEAEASETSALGGNAKPRKTRSRARKPSRSATELMEVLPSAPAMWIRVGPGKFVRADGQDEITAAELEVDSPDEPHGEVIRDDTPPSTTHPAPTATTAPGESNGSEAAHKVPTPDLEIVSTAHPESDVLAATSAREEDYSTEGTQSSEEAEPVEAVQLTLDDIPEPESDPEEYGIAPSAFGSDPLPAFSTGAKGPEPHGSFADTKEVVEAEPGEDVEDGPVGRESHGWIRFAPRSRPPRILGFSGAMRGGSIRSGGTGWSLPGTGPAARSRMRARRRQCFRRDALFQRGHRPRSPPGRL